MENLFNWVVAQDSEQLASFILDVIMNTYCEGLSKSAKDNFFIVNTVTNDAGFDAQQEKRWKSLWKPWMSKWGVTWAKFPDYSNAIETLISKYGDAFANIKIDGHEDPLG
jgi:hypothetical protein